MTFKLNEKQFKRWYDSVSSHTNLFEFNLNAAKYIMERQVQKGYKPYYVLEPDLTKSGKTEKFIPFPHSVI